MRKNSRDIRRFFAATLAVIFACVVVMPETVAYAVPRQPPPRPVLRKQPPRPVLHHYPPRTIVRYRSHSYIRPILPLAFTLLTIAGIEYYYHQGRYYRHTDTRYIVTPPPLGAVVYDLPAGSVTFWANGIQYYYYGKAYYKREPRGYVIVDPPYGPSSKPPVNYQSAMPVNNQAKVMPPMLNVRSGPGTNHEITFQVSQGTILEIHGTAPEWIFVELPSGEFGWVMKKFTVTESVPTQVPAEG